MTERYGVVFLELGDDYINLWKLPGVVIAMFANGMLIAYASQKMRENMLFFVVFGASFIRLALLAIRGAPYEIMTLLISGTLLVWVISLGTGVSFTATRQMVKVLNRDASSSAGRGRQVPGYAGQGA